MWKWKYNDKYNIKEELTKQKDDRKKKLKKIAESENEERMKLISTNSTNKDVWYLLFYCVLLYCVECLHLIYLLIYLFD